MVPLPGSACSLKMVFGHWGEGGQASGDLWVGVERHVPSTRMHLSHAHILYAGTPVTRTFCTPMHLSHTHTHTHTQTLYTNTPVTRTYLVHVVGVVAPHAHRVRTVATISGQTPVNHPTMYPPKQPIEPWKTLVASTPPVFLGFCTDIAPKRSKPNALANHIRWLQLSPEGSPAIPKVCTAAHRGKSTLLCTHHAHIRQQTQKRKSGTKHTMPKGAD